MRQFKHFILILSALTLSLLLGSCSNIGKLTFSDLRVESVSPQGFRAIDVRARAWVDNPSKEFVFSDLEGEVLLDKKIIGNIIVDPVTVDAKSSGKIYIYAKLKLADNVSAVDVMRFAATPALLDKCTLNIHGKAKQKGKSAIIVNRKGLPLRNILDMMRR